MKKYVFTIFSFLLISLIIVGCIETSTPASLAMKIDEKLNRLSLSVTKLDTIDNSYIANPDIFPLDGNSISVNNTIPNRDTIVKNSIALLPDTDVSNIKLIAIDENRDTNQILKEAVTQKILNQLKYDRNGNCNICSNPYGDCNDGVCDSCEKGLQCDQYGNCTDCNQKINLDSYGNCTNCNNSCIVGNYNNNIGSYNDGNNFDCSKINSIASNLEVVPLNVGENNNDRDDLVKIEPYIVPSNNNSNLDEHIIPAQRNWNSTDLLNNENNSSNVYNKIVPSRPTPRTDYKPYNNVYNNDNYNLENISNNVDTQPTVNNTDSYNNYNSNINNQNLNNSGLNSNTNLDSTANDNLNNTNLQNTILDNTNNNLNNNTNNLNPNQPKMYYYYEEGNFAPELLRYNPRFVRDYGNYDATSHLNTYIYKVQKLYAMTADVIEANNTLTNYKESLIDDINATRNLNKNLKTMSSLPSSSKIQALNNYLYDLNTTTRRIRACNGDLNNEINNINHNTNTGISTSIEVMNSNYLRILNHLDTRITFHQTALATLEQLKFLLEETIAGHESAEESLIKDKSLFEEEEKNNILEEGIDNELEENELVYDMNNELTDNNNTNTNANEIIESDVDNLPNNNTGENLNDDLNENTSNDTVVDDNIDNTIDNNNTNEVVDSNVADREDVEDFDEIDTNKNIDTYNNGISNIDTYRNEAGREDNIQDNFVKNNENNNNNDNLNNYNDNLNNNNDNLNNNFNNNLNNNITNDNLNTINNNMANNRLPYNGTNNELGNNGLGLGANNNRFGNNIIYQNNLNTDGNNTNTNSYFYGEDGNLYNAQSNILNHSNKLNNVNTYEYNTLIDTLNQGTVNNGINRLSVETSAEYNKEEIGESMAIEYNDELKTLDLKENTNDMELEENLETEVNENPTEEIENEETFSEEEQEEMDNEEVFEEDEDISEELEEE